MLEQLSKARFLPSSKIAGFFPLLLSREEKGAIFKLRKKHGFGSYSNIIFPLGCPFDQAREKIEKVQRNPE